MANNFLRTQVHEQRRITTGQITTLQIPTGEKIQSLMLYFVTAAGAAVTEAQLRAEIGLIRLTINGVDKISTTAARLLDVYEHFSTRVGTPAGIAGAVELNLGRLVYTDPVLNNLVGFGTADISTIQVQVTALTATNVASVIAISQREPVTEKLGTHCTLIDYPQNFNATGQHTVDTLPRDTNSAYLFNFINLGASGVIASSEARVNGVTITEAIQPNVNALILSNRCFAAVAGYFAHCFTDGSWEMRLPMQGITDLRFITNFTTAPGAAGYTMTPLRLVNTENPAMVK